MRSVDLAAQRQPLGLADNERFFNAAAGMAARASRTDWIASTTWSLPSRGDSVFAVQGDLHDSGPAAQPWSTWTRPAQIPARQSAVSLREQDAQRQGQAQEAEERQQRPALGY